METTLENAWKSPKNAKWNGKNKIMAMGTKTRKCINFLKFIENNKQNRVIFFGSFWGTNIGLYGKVDFFLI